LLKISRENIRVPRIQVVKKKRTTLQNKLFDVDICRRRR
jgi:hypothetical protein